MGDTPELAGQAGMPGAAGSQSVFAGMARRAGARFARNWIYGLVPVVVILGAWEIASAMGAFSPLLFPAPHRIFAALWQMWLEGSLIADILGTLRRLVIGVAFGSVVGIALGALMGYVGAWERMLSPMVNFFLAIPGTALFPVTMMWFGLNEMAILFIIVFEVALTTIVSTWTGVKSIDPMTINAGRSLGAEGIALFWRVLIPAALPSIIGGLRIAFSRAWRIIIVAEMLVAIGHGLGYRLFWAREMFMSDRLYAGLLIVGVVGILIERVFLRPLEKLTVQRWGTVRELD
ncbi:ABC transporter permease [Propylenella binzhouense]|uniref:ABC transporter permease n=1 Tax=Propylenella binzhouense TaxID=2555902 RepID=A0A964T4F5_9HYPH|nr:ABC transporter permease [Propylenella binzhouense]MYZ48316.1 ABC transporter permease [Propylenella binzhouense]